VQQKATQIKQKWYTYLVCFDETNKQWKKWSWDKCLRILSKELDYSRICLL